MANNPINLAVRFLLELAAWGAMGYWGWTQHSGILRVVLGIGLPLVAMALWGTFRVNGDPKEAPVHVPGVVRLALEFAEFGTAVGLLLLAGHQLVAIELAVIIAAHYAVSYDRIAWLLKQK